MYVEKFLIVKTMSEIHIILFGQLCDIAGRNKLVLASVKDTNALQDLLKEKYPALAASKYIIAVDKELVQENTILQNSNIIALLPPFSGG